MAITVYRKAHFNAAHRLYKKEWSDVKNAEIFGKCSNPNYHGHNYKLIVGVSGEIDEETGFVIDLGLLKKIIYEEVEILFDHKNLNIEVEDFKNINPTVENISIVIWKKLKKRLHGKYSLSVTLYETPRNFVVYNGE